MRTRAWMLILGMVLLTGLFPASGADLNRLDRWFVFGTNLAWFGNHYGTDIGPNHAEGWGTSFSAEECERVFANLAKMRCPVVRIWAFERQEGLLFTPDLTTDPRFPYHEVTGLDADFLANCDTIMDCAARHKVMVYWSLLNHLIRKEQGGRHLRIITEAKVRRTYLENACVPFVQRYAQHPALFAIDVINEADGAVGGLDALTGCFDPRQGCSWKEMRTFIKECVAAIHEACPGVKVTATSGYHGWKNVKAGRFSGLGLDFYDWHSYIDEPDLPHARELGLDKPCLIGEIGPKTEEPDAGYRLQGKSWKAYFEQARKGYAGVLTWSYGNPGAASNFVMVEKDHSWRAGALMMARYARGDLFPDAGPLLYDDLEQTELAAINHLIGLLRGQANDPALKSAGGKPWNEFVRSLGFYYPYVNLHYARIVLGRVASRMSGLARHAGAVPALQTVAEQLFVAGKEHPTLATNNDLLRLGQVAGLVHATPAPSTETTGGAPVLIRTNGTRSPFE